MGRRDVMSVARRIRVIDSHTGGEPTRVVVDVDPAAVLDALPATSLPNAAPPSAPPPTSPQPTSPVSDSLPAATAVGSLADRVVELRQQGDWLRQLCIREPRGNDVWVGAWLCPPTAADCRFGVIFFNNVGYLGMCGHGTIGLVVTLGHLGRISPGPLRIDTPVGPVTAVWHGGADVSITNVASRRIARDVSIDVAGVGTVVGDVAWSGNGFFLVRDHAERIAPDNVARLTDVARRIRVAINRAGYPEVDHVELFGPPTVAGADSKNFVLCPGGAFDRSPCGTGTSAKLACLAADGKLAEGEIWVQESLIGSTFEAQFRWLDRDSGEVAPTIRGSAFVTAESTLIVDRDDPLATGIGCWESSAIIPPQQ